MPLSFKPFADESSVVTVDQMTVENRLDRVIVTGSIEITHDKEGLAKAEALLALLQPVLQHLQQQTGLPDHVVTAAPATTANPFLGNKGS
ncbi:hypothetical protein [Polaromonas sp. JS666]|uniref:hypothetical protein n=1 Tax=Polaromonas sp. (strain JS666 / ATCC BAA-500) TaxID=296591 RepID=UPI0000464665|nr:hypothetical protein [Polaromonas sp. JS666]ABE47268.1 conserved hypothetical protein [Polaromonas sp. JS666]